MKELQVLWQNRVHSILSALFEKAPGSPSLSADQVIVEVPPKPEMGDFAFPMFSYAKTLRIAPPLVSRSVADALGTPESGTEITVLGPYVNVKLSRSDLTERTLESVESRGSLYGRTEALSGKKILLEFSSPNTNKPLHLGHLRNNTLGEAVSRILKANGADVRKVNLINDRGVHICKSMLAYQKFGEGRTPQSVGQKSDHFVGDYYVRYAQWAKDHAEAEEQAQELLLKWESGDPDVIALWKTMNEWAVGGIVETYRRTGIVFDQYYFESQTYKLGKDEILSGLNSGAFFRREDGAIVVDLPWKNSPEDEKNAQKVLLRADGTSIYLTQDIGTAISRRRDWPFEQAVYVVANEQDYHFKVLFYVLDKLGFSWAKNLFHLSYGMVNLPEGRMKSREGTVVDADALIDELRDGVLEEIREKGRESELEDPQATAEKIALGALHYYLLQATPSKDMIFNPKESLSFNGNTGPYLQYVGARISSMLVKANESVPQGTFDARSIGTQEEWELIKLLAQFPQFVERSGLEKDPSVLAGFAYDLAKAFSKFYHDRPILGANDANTSVSRLRLSKAVLTTLCNVFELLNIPFLRSM